MKRFVGSATGSSSNPELAAALHRLRSTLARLRAEVELAEIGDEVAPVHRLLDDLKVALALLADVESAAFSLTRVLVLDDDERLAELTARSLRRLGYETESGIVLPVLRRRDVVVFDLGLATSLNEAERAALRSARPIVVTGSADPASRALADDLDASDYLVKPVEVSDLAAAIKRCVANQ